MPSIIVAMDRMARFRGSCSNEEVVQKLQTAIAGKTRGKQTKRRRPRSRCSRREGDNGSDNNKLGLVNVSRDDRCFGFHTRRFQSQPNETLIQNPRGDFFGDGCFDVF